MMPGLASLNSCNHGPKIAYSVSTASWDWFDQRRTGVGLVAMVTELKNLFFPKNSLTK
jgi:hypothetical protein